jgi:hypothetical protein
MGTKGSECSFCPPSLLARIVGHIIVYSFASTFIILHTHPVPFSRKGTGHGIRELKTYGMGTEYVFLTLGPLWLQNPYCTTQSEDHDIGTSTNADGYTVGSHFYTL